MKKARSGRIFSATAMTCRSLVNTRGMALLPKDRAAISVKLRPSAICSIRSSIARAVLRFFCIIQKKHSFTQIGNSALHTPCDTTPLTFLFAWCKKTEI